MKVGSKTNKSVEGASADGAGGAVSVTAMSYDNPERLQ